MISAAAPLAAETLRVGPAERFALPSQAAAVAKPGDVVLIAPGQYRDCAVWRAADLTIRAMPGGAVEIDGPVCQGKALFVISAEDIVIEGLTFRGATAEAGNGAGIRAQGGNLTIRNSRFIGNENGILTHQNPAARLLVEDSAFIGNGALREGRDCAHGIYAGYWGELAIHRSSFSATRICHHVKSRAARTEITDSRIEDGPQGDASYLVDLPNGGDLLLLDNDLAKGPQSDNPAAAVVIGAEGMRRPTRELRIEGNRFENRMSRNTVFVQNRSPVPAQLSGNRLTGRVTPLAGPGTTR